MRSFSIKLDGGRGDSLLKIDQEDDEDEDVVEASVEDKATSSAIGSLSRMCLRRDDASGESGSVRLRRMSIRSMSSTNNLRFDVS